MNTLCGDEKDEKSDESGVEVWGPWENYGVLIQIANEGAGFCKLQFLSLNIGVSNGLGLSSGSDTL